MNAIWKQQLSRLVAVALVGLFAGTGTVKADSYQYSSSYRHIDRLALRLQRQADQLLGEVRIHCRLTPQFYFLERDVSAMCRLSAHLHEVAHSQGDRRHLRVDVQRLDRLFHQVEEHVANLDRFPGPGRRGAAHLREVLDEMGETLHQLRDDLRRVERR